MEEEAERLTKGKTKIYEWHQKKRTEKSVKDLKPLLSLHNTVMAIVVHFYAVIVIVILVDSQT